MPAVGLHVPVKPVVETLGVPGRPTPPGNTTEIVLLPPVVFNAPVAVVVNPTVHGTTAFALVLSGENVTLVTAPAVITTFAGDAFAVSELVCTKNVEPVTVPGPGFVIPAIVTVAAVVFANEQPAPDKVIVTV